MNYFDSFEYLEPKCPCCGTKIKYGINTEFREDVMSQVCKCCNKPL